MTKIPNTVSRDQSIKKINDAFTEIRQNKGELYRVRNSTFDRCQSCVIKNDGYFVNYGVFVNSDSATRILCSF